MQIRAEHPVRFRLSCLWLFAAAAFLAACTPENPIEYENSQAGTPQAVWDVAGAGDPTIQGFATEISVNKGQTISFKVDTDASGYRLDIYRMGWYQGNGARLITSVLPSAALPQAQPECLTDSTGLIDCGNWTVSASWVVPGNLVSGIYFARLVRTDTNGASHVFFVVRDDGRNAPILFQTADTTWHAVNNYGGSSLSEGNPPVGRAYKVSYNRPLVTRAVGDGESSVMNAEYPMVRWLERQSYDVAYFTGVDADRYGAQILNRKIYLSNGHDAFWSGGQRANVEAALAAGVNLAFASGNKIFWKTRFEPSIDGSATPHRTLVCYKETLENAVIDPASPIWTGTWRDPRFSPPGDGGRPENALGGSIFRIDGPYSGAVTLTGAEGRMRTWRNTGLAETPLEDVVTLAPGSLGDRLDVDEDNGFRPPGLIGLSATPISTPDAYLTDFGSTYGAGSATHRLTLHRHPTSGAQVFSTGTYQWSWGLDANHDRSALGATTDVRMMQATVNVFADMGVAPKTPQPGLVYSSPAVDTTAPSATITSPLGGAEIPVDTLVTVTGTASDVGGLVASVEVSTDGGATWHPATGRESWSYAWLANAAGAATLRARASDDSARLGAASTPVPVTVTEAPPELVSIAVTPTDASLVVGGSQPYTATGTYSDASTEDLSAQVVWESSNVAAATVDAGGLATAVAPGATTITATLGTVSGGTGLTVTPPALEITTTALPDGNFGAAYAATVQVTGGVPPYTFAISVATLPPGLVLDEDTGEITGIPAQSGVFGFDVQVTDATPTVVARPLAITVAPGALVSILVLPEAPTMNTGGTLPFTATGTYADASTQDLTGAVAWGSSSSAIVSIDAGGLATAQATGATSITATLGAISDDTLVTVEPGTGLEIVTSTLPDGADGVSYAATLAGSGGVLPYAWAVPAGLPPGLTVDENTGEVSGTPTEPGVYSFVAVLTDAGLATATRPLSITIAPAPLVSIAVTPEAPAAVVGAQQAFTATGTYADASTQDLSAQVTWASSDEGVATIDASGLASALAVGTTTISATQGEISGGTLLSVTSLAPEITTSALPDGAYGVAYSATLAATGGTPPYTWAVPAGLPPGLTVNASTGEITGTPLAGGLFGFTVEVTDAALQLGTRALSITIPAVQNYSLWPGSAVPTLADGGPDAPVTLGVRFRSDVDGFISGIRFYKHPLNTGTHVGSLWTEAGALLGTATFTGESGSGWQQVNFGGPVPITADTVYIASYFVPNGHYSADTLYFQNAGVDSPPLHAPQSVLGARNGLFAYGPASTFPDQSFNAANYWVDVVFTSQPAAPLVSITVTPPGPTIATGGGTQQFLATGTYADANTLDITGQVTWETGTPAVATISATGLATALTPGSTTVTATLGTVSGGATLDVSLGTLAVTTTTLPSVIVGTPYSATLAASGGILPYAWTIAAGLPPGLVLNPATGAITGTPTDPGTFPFTAEVSDASAQDASAPLSITIDAVPVLTSIAVTPSTPTLAAGTAAPLTATGTYSNATQQNLTALVAWSSSDGSVATVSATGELTAWNPGSATITATLGTVDGTASATVTAGVPGATGGPGGPILVVTHEGNPYARYLVDILETEGFQAYTVMDIANVSPATLAAYDVVVLGEFPLTAAQVSMVEAWVNAGGNLIAMRPDKQLATLLGLSDLAATIPNGYLRVETAGGPGAGIVGETIQYHGTSDVYALDGATQVAELYTDATTSTEAPAVTLHQPLLGRAAAFSYDLARSVVWTRQGNPAWSGQSRTGASILRSVELFFGNAAGDPQPDWVDLDKVAIPQADEQQRLLANLILQMNLANKPLPRFWYLPFGHKAAVVMTGDDHANGGTAARFDAYANASVPACSVADWGCVRSTSYVFTGSLTAPQASAYEAAGFEVALLVDTGCINWSSAGSLLTLYTNQQTAFGAAYPGVPAPTTSRTNCIVWSDYDTQPAVELARGVRLDTNYYYFPGSWVQDRPGFMTGSGMPMRFTDRSGERIDVYQAATQMTAESGQSYPATVDTLLDGALGANGYYGVFTASMATDFASPVGPGADAWTGSNAIVASAQSRGVPVVSARQMLTWLDGRNGSSFGNLAWNGTVLSFTVTAAPGAENLRAMLPFAGPGVTFDGITQDGNPVPFFTQTVKGVVYAIFPATTGAYEATYQ